MTDVGNYPARWVAASLEDTMKPRIREWEDLSTGEFVVELRVPRSYLTVTQRPRTCWWLLKMAWRLWVTRVAFRAWVKP
jgi:hypothetical protein